MSDATSLFSVLRSRRSHSVLRAPGPSREQLGQLLDAAFTAPDHGRRSPWRFVILEGEGKDAFTDVMEKAYRARSSPEDCTEATIARERGRLGRAPVVVVAACLADPGDSIPRDERYAATAAATQNLLLASTALGFGSIWRTGWPVRDATVKAALGFDSADDIIGFIYLGTPHEERTAPPRPIFDRETLFRFWPPGSPGESGRPTPGANL